MTWFQSRNVFTTIYRSIEWLFWRLSSSFLFKCRKSNYVKRIPGRSPVTIGTIETHSALRCGDTVSPVWHIETHRSKCHVPLSRLKYFFILRFTIYYLTDCGKMKWKVCGYCSVWQVMVEDKQQLEDVTFERQDKRKTSQYGR